MAASLACTTRPPIGLCACLLSQQRTKTVGQCRPPRGSSLVGLLYLISSPTLDLQIILLAATLFPSSHLLDQAAGPSSCDEALLPMYFFFSAEPAGSSLVGCEDYWTVNVECSREVACCSWTLQFKLLAELWQLSLLLVGLLLE